MRGAGHWQWPDKACTSTSIRSLASGGSILSIGSTGSILSIGSTGSILSVGSAGSIGSAGSAGSILSIESVGSFLSVGSAGLLAVVLTVTALAGISVVLSGPFSWLLLAWKSRWKGLRGPVQERGNKREHLLRAFRHVHVSGAGQHRDLRVRQDAGQLGHVG
jgi:hypothetical protein